MARSKSQIKRAKLRVRDPGCGNDSVSPTSAQQARAAAITAEITARLAAVNFALPGTVPTG
jgi:hypothetical protein